MPEYISDFRPVSFLAVQVNAGKSWQLNVDIVLTFSQYFISVNYYIKMVFCKNFFQNLTCVIFKDSRSFCDIVSLSGFLNENYVILNE